MSTRIKVRRRVTSGDIKDPELHKQRIINIEKTREFMLTLAVVGIGVIVFFVVVIASAIS